MSGRIVKVAELEGAALDYAVAKALGAEFHLSSIDAIHARVDGKFIGGFVTKRPGTTCMPDRHFSPSRQPDQGWPIIERERIALEPMPGRWLASLACNDLTRPWSDAYGPTGLIAAMRAYVASKFSETVELPIEVSR